MYTSTYMSLSYKHIYPHVYIYIPIIYYRAFWPFLSFYNLECFSVIKVIYLNEENPGTLFFDERREISFFLMKEEKAWFCGDKNKKKPRLWIKCFRKFAVCFIYTYKGKPNFWIGSLKSELLPKDVLNQVHSLVTAIVGKGGLRRK